MPKVCRTDPAIGVSFLWLLLLPGWLTLPRYFSVLERQNTEERLEGMLVVYTEGVHHVVQPKSLEDALDLGPQSYKVELG